MLVRCYNVLIYHKHSIRRAGARILSSGWLVPVTVLFLLSVIAPASLSTSSPHLRVSDTPAGDVRMNIQTPYASYKQLDVPPAEQGETRWCFEASLSMVLRYYGKAVTPEDIAENMGIGPDESTGFLTVFFGGVESYLANWRDLAALQHIGNWSFDRYVDLIDAGTPVIASTFGLPGHTVVVTGYAMGANGDYLFVNDPSGYYTRLEWGTYRTQQAMVSWSRFSGYLWSELVISRKQ
jgi:hypothetical protein